MMSNHDRYLRERDKRLARARSRYALVREHKYFIDSLSVDDLIRYVQEGD